MQKLNITITTTESLLGSANANPEVYREFIASKSPSAEAAREEIESLPVETQMEKATTVFPRDEKGIFLWDYQLRGFLKEAIGVACELGEEVSKPLTKWTYKRAVDSLVFVNPRRIYAYRDGSIIKVPDSSNTRPLRAATMQGDRVALASSEQLDAGVTFSAEIAWLSGTNSKSKIAINEDMITWALNYGAMKGLGQWRGGGFGRFKWEAAK